MSEIHRVDFGDSRVDQPSKGNQMKDELQEIQLKYRLSDFKRIINDSEPVIDLHDSDVTRL